VARRTGYERYVIGVLFLLVALLFLTSACATAAEIATGQGFGRLKWGDTIDEALRVYPDLRFEGYRIVREKEPPFRVYVRGRATDRVDGIRFDSLEYWFQADRFLEMRAVLSSRIGPRTLVTEAERSYDMLADRIRRAYGAPGRHSVRYVTEYLAVIKEARWDTQGVSIRLRYNGAEQGDVDRLTLEMAESGGIP